MWTSLSRRVVVAKRPVLYLPEGRLGLVCRRVIGQHIHPHSFSFEGLLPTTHRYTVVVFAKITVV